MARILIVDDDADFVDSVTLFLKQAGHETTSASNREDGMRLANEGELDLLILDIMMNEPDDGIAMAQELRRNGFDKPILIMSSISKVTGFSYDKDDAMVPVDDFLEKPVNPDVLTKKVSALLETPREDDIQ
jgi:DNA-binding response OmpR family regulator